MEQGFKFYIFANKVRILGMKISSYIIFLLFAMVFSLNAQSQVRFGVTGGLLVNKVNVENPKAMADNYTGWYVGPTLEVGVPGTGIKVDGSVLYTRNGARFKGLNETSTSNFDEASYTHEADYVSIPVNLKLVLGSSRAVAVYVSAGPQFDYVISENDTHDCSVTFSKTQMSFNVGGGVRLLKHLQVGVYYNFPTGHAAKMPEIIENKMWHANAVLFF